MGIRAPGGDVHGAAGDQAAFARFVEAAPRESQPTVVLVGGEYRHFHGEGFTTAYALEDGLADLILIFLEVEQHMFGVELVARGQVQQVEKALRPVQPVAVSIHLPDADAAALLREAEHPGVQGRCLTWADAQGILNAGAGVTDGAPQVDGEEIAGGVAYGDQGTLALLQGVTERRHQGVVLAAGHESIHGQALHLKDAVAKQGFAGVVRCLYDALVVHLQAGGRGIGAGAGFRADPLEQEFPHSVRD